MLIFLHWLMAKSCCRQFVLTDADAINAGILIGINGPKGVDVNAKQGKRTDRILLNRIAVIYKGIIFLEKN